MKFTIKIFVRKKFLFVINAAIVKIQAIYKSKMQKY